jgi:hypothetical protein
MVEVQDLEKFKSGGYGYLGHESRSSISDANLVAAANQLGLQKEDLALWCDSRWARHRMDKADIKTLNSPKEFKLWLGKDLAELHAELPYTEKEITNAVDYLFKMRSDLGLSTGELALSVWINDSMLSGDISSGSVSQVRLVMTEHGLTTRL